MVIDQFIGRAGRVGYGAERASAFFLVRSDHLQSLKRIVDDDIIIKKDFDPYELACDFMTSEIVFTLPELIISLEQAGIETQKINESLKYLMKNKILTNDNNFLDIKYLGKMCAYFFIHPKMGIELSNFNEDYLDLLQMLAVKTIRYDKEVDIDKIESVLKHKPNLINYEKETLKAMYYLFYNDFKEKKMSKKDRKRKERFWYLYKGHFGRYIQFGKIISKNPAYSDLDMSIRYKRMLGQGELGLLKIKGIGRKRYDSLIKYGIRNVDIFKKTKNEKLSLIINLNEKIIERMKRSVE
jgi:hypothetical protein